jgi:DNA polymerase III epsilon subunit-like protein
MNTNNYIFFDFETGSLGANVTQPTQIAAVAVNGRTLEFTKNDIFSSEIQPILDDEKAEALGLHPVEDKALELTHKTREALAEAPTIDVVWPKFVEFVKRYKDGNSQWGNPIAAGFNIVNFDLPIVNRICGREPWNLGPWDKKWEVNSLFHPRDVFDLQKFMGAIYENIPGVKSQSFDTYRSIYGFESTGMEHDARVDVIQGAALMVRKLQWMRKFCSRKKFENTMQDFDIKEFM